MKGFIVLVLCLATGSGQNTVPAASGQQSIVPAAKTTTASAGGNAATSAIVADAPPHNTAAGTAAVAPAPAPAAAVKPTVMASQPRPTGPIAAPPSRRTEESGYYAPQCSDCPGRMQCTYSQTRGAKCYYAAHQICYLRPDSGCRSANYHFQWYYDQSTDSCYPFYWGGCGGNGNRFRTVRECEAACMSHYYPYGDIAEYDPYGYNGYSENVYESNGGHKGNGGNAGNNRGNGNAENGSAGTGGGERSNADGRGNAGNV